MIFIHSCKEHPGQSVETDIPGKHHCRNCGQTMIAKKIGVKFKIEDVTLTDNKPAGGKSKNGMKGGKK